MFLYEFAAIVALVRTRNRHLVPNFWQWTSGFSEIEPQSLGSREWQKQSLWFKQTQKDTKASDKVHDIHKYFGEISVSLVCSVPHLSPLYRFLTVLYAVFGFGPIFLRFWMIFSFGFAVSNIPQCPPQTPITANLSTYLIQEFLVNVKCRMDGSHRKPYICLSFDFLIQYSTNGTCLTLVSMQKYVTSLWLLWKSY